MSSEQAQEHGPNSEFPGQSRDSLSSLAHKCRDKLKQLEETFEEVSPEQEEKAAAVHNARGRFNVWGQNMGALRPTSSKSSLDWRLRKAERMNEAIRSSLRNITDAGDQGT